MMSQCTGLTIHIQIQCNLLLIRDQWDRKMHQMTFDALIRRKIPNMGQKSWSPSVLCDIILQSVFTNTPGILKLLCLKWLATLLALVCDELTQFLD